MKKIIILIIFLLSATYYLKAQHNRSLGIMRDVCNESTNVTPFLEVSLGSEIFERNHNNNVFKIDVDYVTQSNFSYGFTFGTVPNKRFSNNIETKLFLGYYLGGCVLLGPTIGMTNITTFQIDNNKNLVVYKGWHSNFGFSIKFISGEVLFGGYGSSTGIGLTIGKIF